MTKDQLPRLTRLLSLPTAPFRELHVARHARRFLDEHGVPHFDDPLGNIVVGAASQRDYQRLMRRRTSGTLGVFVAHMDHPGFHGVRWLGADRLGVKWYGGSPVKRVAGARVRLVDEDGVVGSGMLRNVRLARHRRAIATADVVVAKSSFGTGRRPAARRLFGGFSFRSPVWRSHKRIYCPAADDLVGVFTVLETARRVWRHGAQRQAPFLGLLTRAEEVGFVGAVGHLNLGWLQQARRPLMVISLEASRTLPGAAIGGGPVVRLGDRSTVFDADGIRTLTNTAARVLPGAYQRRIMDGGSCEATAVTAWGLPAIGISVPLGNYHNQGFEGGPDSRPDGPSPEFVSMDDIDGLLRLCAALAEHDHDWVMPWRRQRSALEKNYEKLQRLL